MRHRAQCVLVVCAPFVALFFACNSVSDLVSEVLTDATVTDANSTTATDSTAQVATSADQEDPNNYVWDTSDIVYIALADAGSTVTGSGASVSGSTITIASAGTYSVSGTLTNGQLLVDAGNDALVQVILAGVDIRNSTTAPIYVRSADTTVIILADSTTNYVRDATSYVLTDPNGNDPTAAVFSADDLTIYGNGALTIDGQYKDGITSKDGLIIKSGTLTVRAADDGIRGKDYLIVDDGTITVTASGDGMKADNEEDTTKGFITVAAGTLTVTSGGDALTAAANVFITGGHLVLKAGGGSTSTVSTGASAKGIKGTAGVSVAAGTIAINSAEDGIHSNGTVDVSGGTLAIAAADDGIHADVSLVVDGGDINVTKSYEGLESRAVITINGGTIHITSTDDGVNVAGGVDGSATDAWPGAGGMNASENCYLYINGGYMEVTTAGDGIDVNGACTMTGGEVLVNGPTSSANGALDHVSFKMTGGFLLAVGSSGMAQGPDSTSTQCSLLCNLRAAQKAGTLIHIQKQGGASLVTFAPTKAYQSIAFSSPEFTTGVTYELYLGGSSTGTATDGLYENGTYTAGTKYATMTLSSIVTTLR